MNNNLDNYFYKKMPDNNFFDIIFVKKYKEPGIIFSPHWHEHIQFFYFIEGQAVITCNSKKLNVIRNDIAVVNVNELHSMESLCNNLCYYIIRVDLAFLFSNQVDSCQTKFMLPLAQNLILFKNLVRNDIEVIECTKKIIEEYNLKHIGFELAIKAYIYRLVVLLMRNYIEKILTKEEFDHKMDKLNSFNLILKYIDSNYTKKINIKELSAIIHVNGFYFCRLFKQITGETAMEYINRLRLNKASQLLLESNLNITEIALACGFDDPNYFSRIFKKAKSISPSELRKKYSNKNNLFKIS